MIPSKALIVAVFASIILFACTDSATNVDTGPAAVEGRVDNVSSNESESSKVQVIEGATVTAAQVTTGGNLDTIGDAEAETDTQGTYTLEISSESMANIGTTSRILVSAQSEEGIGRAFVTSGLQGGSTVQAKPITIESTVETNVLQEVFSNNDVDVVANADIEAVVDSTAAASMDGNTAAASELAAILANQARVRSEFYAREGVDISTEEVDQIKTDAQIQLESSLHDLAGNVEAQQNAFNAFLETYANAEMDAGTEASEAAKAALLASRITLNEGELTIEALTRVRNIQGFRTAVALDVAVRNELETAGAESSTIGIAEDAGNTLRSEIRASTTATEEELNTLFTEYKNKIITAIEGDANIDGSTFVTVNNIISGDGGAQAEFESAVENTSDPQLIVDAYSEFFSNVRSSVSSGFDETDDVRIDAYTDLLILLSLAS